MVNFTRDYEESEVPCAFCDGVILIQTSNINYGEGYSGGYANNRVRNSYCSCQNSDCFFQLDITYRYGNEDAHQETINALSRRSRIT